MYDFLKGLEWDICPIFAPKNDTNKAFSTFPVVFYFQTERWIDCYAENEQEAETRVGIVSERKKSHCLQWTLQKVQSYLQAEFSLYRGTLPEIFIKKENEEK